MKTERKDFYPTYGKMSYFNLPGGMDGLFLQTTHLPCGLDYGWACWFHRGVLEWVNGLLYLHTKGKFKNTWKQGPVLTHVSINWSYTRGSWVCIRTCRESEKVKSLSRVWLFAIPWTVAYHAPPSMGFSSKSTGVGCHCLLQRIFLTQGSNPGLPQCKQILYHLSHQGSPGHAIAE